MDEGCKSSGPDNENGFIFPLRGRACRGDDTHDNSVDRQEHGEGYNLHDKRENVKASTRCAIRFTGPCRVHGSWVPCRQRQEKRKERGSTVPRGRNVELTEKRAMVTKERKSAIQCRGEDQKLMKWRAHFESEVEAR